MLKLVDDVVWREMDGETILLDLRKSLYLSVNETGMLLWRLLSEGTTADALEAALVDAHSVSPETARADVAEFLADCRRREFIVDDE